MKTTNLQNNNTDIKNSQNVATSIQRPMLEGEHDAMIAKLFVEKHTDNIVFDTSRKEWKVFQDGIWLQSEDAEKLIFHFYYQLILDIDNNAYQNLPTFSRVWLCKQMNRGNLSSALKIVQVMTAIGINKLNAKHNLIGIQEKVFDCETVSMRPAQASDLVMKSLGTNYDENAQCPEWKKFLNTAMQDNQAMLDYLQRLVGYFLTASTKEQEIYYFYGTGANGKSTFLDLVKALLGTYGVKVSSDSFMKKNSGTLNLGSQASLAMLAGARLAITDETNDGDTAFDVQTLKSISGDDEVTGRFLRQNPITFKSTAKLVMYGNDKPYGNINDEGFWRRFRFIHFNYVVPKEERDSDLLDKLKEELPGILNWALEGLKSWQENGLNTPELIMQESIDYRTELDTIKEFLDRAITTEINSVVPTSQLYDEYKTWTKENLKETESKQAFSKRIKRYFSNSDGVQPYKNSKTRGYKGIKLVTTSD